MARLRRPNIAGAYYHVINRGTQRRDIVTSDEDRGRFVRTLAKYVDALDYEVFAYCLMTNHFHILLRTRKANISKILQRIQVSYVMYFNHRYNLTGHLFQGRAKTYLVDPRTRLLDLSRYIHLNPVSAGMIDKPEEYPWSSLKYYIPGKRSETFVRTDKLPRKAGSRKKYMDFVYEGIGKGWSPKPLERLFVGTEAFMKRMKKKLGWDDETDEKKTRPKKRGGIKPDRILREVAKEYRIRVTDLVEAGRRTKNRSHARQMAAYVLRRLTNLRLREIGELLGGVTGAAVRMAEKSVEESELRRKQAERLRSRLLR